MPVRSGTLTPNVVTQVTFPLGYGAVEIMNTGSIELWVRMDGVNPTVGGDDSIIVPAMTYAVINNPKPTSNTTDVRMVAYSTTEYSVSGGL